MYGFAILDPNTFTLKIYDPWLDVDMGNYLAFTGLKNKNKALKTMLALGGWNDSITPDKKYSVLVSSPARIANFVANVVPLLKQYNFDGLDVDWEYPADDADKKGYVALLQALREAFEPEGLLLSSAVSCNPLKIDAGYDVPEVSRLVDFVSVMTYDIHGSWDPDLADHHAPLFARSWSVISNNDNTYIYSTCIINILYVGIRLMKSQSIAVCNIGSPKVLIQKNSLWAFHSMVVLSLLQVPYTRLRLQQMEQESSDRTPTNRV
jgi:chitinase